MKTNELRLNSFTDSLIKNGLLEIRQVANALQQSQQHNLSLISYLVHYNLVDSKKILHNCAELFALPIFDEKTYGKLQLCEFISPELARRYKVVPLATSNFRLHLGISDPTDQASIEALLFHTGLQIYPVLMTEEQLNTLLDSYCQLSPSDSELTLLTELSFNEDTSIVKETNQPYEEPVIKFVEAIIKHALQKRASDIHIEPFEKNCRIRFRQDGILYPITEIPNPFATRVITRLKVMARMDISERRLPQDGRFQLNTIDMRISTCPTVTGEKIALRILDANKISLEISSLGFNPCQEQVFLHTLSRPQGMLLVTGPTGSGKTVTLYAALRHLNSTEKNISTAEDPIEIQLNGINQVNIHPKIGLHFSTLLRTFLRQDPDVLMIGEIRDYETAGIAIQAAETGHLVLSTVHSNSTIEALTRLQAMGIETHHLSHAIVLIVSQRLARKLCQHCKKLDTASNTYLAQACSECLQGYHGRTGIYEFLPVTAALVKFLLTETNPKNIETQLKKIDFLSLRQAGMEKVHQGITSLAEIDRITQA